MYKIRNEIDNFCSISLGYVKLAPQTLIKIAIMCNKIASLNNRGELSLD